MLLFNQLSYTRETWYKCHVFTGHEIFVHFNIPTLINNSHNKDNGDIHYAYMVIEKKANYLTGSSAEVMNAWSLASILHAVSSIGTILY
jgi:hypothetical protein